MRKRRKSVAVHQRARTYWDRVLTKTRMAGIEELGDTGRRIDRSRETRVPRKMGDAQPVEGAAGVAPPRVGVAEKRNGHQRRDARFPSIGTKTIHLPVPPRPAV